MPVAVALPAVEGVGSGQAVSPMPLNASLLLLLLPSLLSDPNVHSRETVAESASEGGWNENGESLLRLDLFGEW